MSHKATNWAVEQRGLKPAAKVVLWHLADRHNTDLGCFPSQELLARDCEMSRSTLNLHLNTLEERGLIRREQRRNEDTRKQLNTRYKLAFEDDFEPVNTEIPCPKTGHGKTEDPVSEKTEIPCPKNSESRVRNSDTNPVREPGTQPGSAQARARGPEKRTDQKIEKLFWKLVKDWPQLKGMPKAKARAPFEQLSEEEQDEALEKRDAWLDLLKFQGRDHVPAPSTYCREKLWKDIPEGFGKNALQGETSVAPPFGKAWGAARFACLVLEPTGSPPKLTMAQEQMIDQGLYSRDDLLREKRAMNGWPRVNTMHERAIRRRLGVACDPALAGLADLFGKVHRDSPAWIAWRDLHAKKGWPWFGPDRDCPEWVWMPAPPDGPETYSNPFAEVRAALARFEAEHANLTQRQAAE